jgi:hypothetical protein
MMSEDRKGGEQAASSNELPDSESAELLSSQFESPWFYFYRLGGHHDATKAYRIERPASVPYDQVPRAIDEIFEDLPAKPDGTDIGDLTWRHKAYLVFVLEHASEEITWVNFDRLAGGAKNSFLHGKVLPSVAARSDVSAFYCVNYMRSRNNVELVENESELFRVKVDHGPRTVGREHPVPENDDGRPLDIDLPTLGHEDAGTNLGPPKNP